MKQKSKYSEELNKDALQLLNSNGKSRSPIERDLGLSQGLLPMATALLGQSQ